MLGILELTDGTSVNKELIRKGYARPYGELPTEATRPDRIPSVRRAAPA